VGATVTERTHAEPKGLEDLYLRHAASAVRLAFLITGDSDLAGDIAQDAFVRVAGRFRHLRFPDSFDAYLRSTVANLCTSHFRRARLEREYLKREEARGEPSLEGPDASDGDELRGALWRLPIRQRTAIVLRYYQDLSEEGVADAMRCSVPAARSLISRGLQTLRTNVKGDA
jgi:RNA polymerase sigma factor (sigma-70 family)